MSRTSNHDGRFRIVFYLLIVAVLVLIIGEGVYREAGSSGLTLLNIALSAILTAALVILYFRQTNILESQRNLLTQELNREARQQHTETLRDRVRTWHGNPDRETPDDLIESPQRNFPVIKPSSFASAPNGYYTRTFEDEFQVIPDQLEDDRYLQDLLENHATDLQDTKDEIEDLHERFVALRDQFDESIEVDAVREKEAYTLRPREYFFQWIFEYLVRDERGFFDDFDDLRADALSMFEQGEARLDSDENRILVLAGIGGGDKRVIYHADNSSSDLEDIDGLELEAKEDVEEIVGDVLDHIEEQHPIDQAVEAAKILDEAQEAVDTLDQLLIEYDGRPIFPGDCKYLEEARISESKDG